MRKSSNFWTILFLGLCCFLLGVLGEKVFFHPYFLKLEKQKNNLHDSLSVEKKFTNPLLECNSTFSFISPKLESIILDKAAYYSKNQAIKQVSVYFRDLNSGISYGANENESFIPENLNNLCLMIAALKLTDESPDILGYRFTYDEATGAFKKIDTTEVKGQKVSLYDIYSIVEYMIQFSNNETAVYINELLNSINTKLTNKVFSDLGLDKAGNNITTKDYASLLSLLYNSTYINNKNSEKALFFLSETDFKEGLNVGIGNDSIDVAHYYGQTEDNTSYQLHDCGILYYPGNSYILNVMVKGSDIEQMKTVIQEVSKAVYTEVKTQVHP